MLLELDLPSVGGETEAGSNSYIGANCLSQRRTI